MRIMASTKPKCWCGRLLFLMAVAATLGACQPSKPAHYYVLCDDQDYNGWTLVDFEKDDAGYLMACTYQSPDRQQSYTSRCQPEGCD